VRYLFFPGCQVLARQAGYELAVRNVSKALGVDLVDMPDMNCCGPVTLRSVESTVWLILSSRILARAEKMELGLMTICNGCFASLNEAKAYLKKDKKLKEKVNRMLSTEELEYVNGVNVKHFVQVLHQDLGLEKIKQAVEKKFEGLNAATHYGCHVLRPSSDLNFDDAENPKLLDNLVELTGAKSVYWPLKLWCCGAITLPFDEKLALDLAWKKIVNAKESDANCIVTICPYCQLQFDLQQPRLRRLYGQEVVLPSVTYPQLLGLVMGFTQEEVGLNLNTVPAQSILSFLR